MWFRKLGSIPKEKLLEELWRMHDKEDERIKLHEPLTTAWVLCDGRRSAIIDMISYIKHTR